LITAEQARRDYGVAIDASGEIDRAETAHLRSFLGKRESSASD
jgi:hypothetical protein